MPEWHIKITGIAPLFEEWNDGEGDLEAIKTGVVSKVKAAVDYEEGDDLELDEALTNMEDAPGETEFNEALSELYDWADKARVWIDPIT
jgi:hypothetical protein